MKRIVVIGTGGAGLVSATAARKAGAEVMVLSKTSRGSASSTAYSAGIFLLACDGVTPNEKLWRRLNRPVQNITVCCRVRIVEKNRKHCAGNCRRKYGMRLVRSDVQTRCQIVLLILATSKKISIDTPMDHLYALEMEELVLTAEAVANAALKRQENIGTHYRVLR